MERKAEVDCFHEKIKKLLQPHNKTSYIDQENELSQIRDNLLKLIQNFEETSKALNAEARRSATELKLLEEMDKYERIKSSNDIDIVDGYDLIIAKKMHMWGNGL